MQGCNFHIFSILLALALSFSPGKPSKGHLESYLSLLKQFYSIPLPHLSTTPATRCPRFSVGFTHQRHSGKPHSTFKKLPTRSHSISQC
ncbi:hypothetical protein DL93DRAFT_46842 [Clavulina sp. PMI_390]|nr:hypothetical protein DL93DRAFT_46842 [Clavulina sp. PMI_390]